MSWAALREKYDALADSHLRRRARILIVGGYIVAAIGYSVDAVESITESHHFVWPYNLQSLASLAYPLSWFASAWAFWWLANVTIVGSFQISMIRKAFIGLAVQTSLLAGAFVLNEIVIASTSTSGMFFGVWWIMTSIWLTGIGAVLTAVGFIMLARVFSPVRPLYTKRDRI